MKRFLVAAWVMALAAPAMAKDVASGLTGNWTVDMAAAFEADPPPFYKLATPEKKKQILADAMKSAPVMVLEFTATTASMKSGSQPPEVAKFAVTKQDKTTVWADMTPPKKDGTDGPTEKFTFEFVDANTVKMLRVGDPVAMVLKRAK